MQIDSKDTTPPSPGRLITCRHSPALRKTLWRLVREAKGGDVLAPVTVVGPSSYVNLSLRQDLGRSSFVNVRFIVIPVLSELLGAAALARARRKPLPAVLEGVMVRDALAGAGDILKDVSEHPATQASVRRLFYELRRVAEDVLASLQEKGRLCGEVVRLFREFRRNTRSEWYDSEDLAQAAVEVVTHGEIAGLDDLGTIVFFLPRDASPSETKLVKVLAEQRRCYAFLGMTGDAIADRPVDTLKKALVPMLGEPVPAVQDDAEMPLLSRSARMHIAPNAHEELRWVIRRIVRKAEEDGVPFHRMAVLYRMDNPYATLVPDEMRMSGIPVSGPDRSTLADSAAGRTLFGLLAMSGSDMRREDVMAWLTGCPVRPAGAGGFNPSRWDALTRKAGIVRGAEQWRDRLNHYAVRLNDAAARLAGREEITEARAERMRSEAAAALQVSSFIEKLGADVEPPEEGSTWRTFCQWADKLLDRYLDDDIPDDEETALEGIQRAIEELEAADSIRAWTTFDQFKRTIEDSLRSTIGHLGTIGTGVFVSPIRGAAGMRFESVWMVGMIEGGMPPPFRPDPLLPESDWHAAGGDSRMSQRVAGERYDYLAAAATSPHLEFSYPVADPASQREAYPSRWFLEQASFLEGAPVHANGLGRLLDRGWLTTDESAEHALVSIGDASLADRHDYNLHRLLRWRRSAIALLDHPFAADGILARAGELTLRRNQSRLTAFDGNLSSVAREAGILLGLHRAPVSATRLESWARCPFSYFLGHVLRLSALEAPEETTFITPLERGSLIHRILARFMTEVNEENKLAPPGAERSDRSRRQLFRIAEEEFALAESRGVTGKPLIWNLDKQDIRADLETFIEEDANLRARYGTGYTLVEEGFGHDGAPEVKEPRTGVRFRGYIDRIDVNPSSRSVLVIDYKTGGARQYEGLKSDPIDGGRRLQLGVYSLAARRLVADAGEIRAAYWFTTTRGRFAFHPPEDADVQDDAVRARFQAALSTIVSGIQDGVFPANPGPDGFGGPENCRFCDFDSLCAARRTEIWERKREDSLLSGYRLLANDVEEPE